MLQNLEATNQMIIKGLIVADSNGNLTFTKKMALENPRLLVQQNELIVPEARATAGQTKIVQYWWGFDIYLSNTVANRIADGFDIYVTLRGYLVGQFKFRVIVALVALFTSRQLKQYNKGRGVIIRYNQVLNIIAEPPSALYSLASIRSQ